MTDKQRAALDAIRAAETPDEYRRALTAALQFIEPERQPLIMALIRDAGAHNDKSIIDAFTKPHEEATTS